MLDALLDLFDRDRRCGRGILGRFGAHDHDHDHEERPVSYYSRSPRARRDQEWRDDDRADRPRHRRRRPGVLGWDD